jgi:hypothetical protein
MERGGRGRGRERERERERGGGKERGKGEPFSLTADGGEESNPYEMTAKKPGPLIIYFFYGVMCFALYKVLWRLSWI